MVNWITVDPTTGSGNGSVVVTAASANTGRNSRSTELTWQAANCTDVVRTVSQAGKPEFVSLQSTAAVGKTGGALTITGTSNSSKLTFSLGSTGDLSLTLPQSYTANSASTTNGAAITGDPGASSTYNFSITFSNIAANGTITAKTKYVTVSANGGQTSSCTVTQAAGDPTLSVSPASLSLGWENGSTDTATVTSNTSWEVV